MVCLYPIKTILCVQSSISRLFSKYSSPFILLRTTKKFTLLFGLTSVYEKVKENLNYPLLLCYFTVITL